MAHETALRGRRPLAILLTLIVMLAATPSALAAKKFDGRWVLTITIPVSPGSNNKRTFNIHVEASPRGESQHGRMTITDEQGRTAAGTWRQSSKKVTFSYELPCLSGDAAPCATLVLQGKMKSSGMEFKKGNVIVIWDTANASNPALFDTSNGSFRGARV